VWALALTPGLILANRDLEFFEKEIRPLLVEHCYECHSVEAGKSKGGLRLDSRAALLDGGDSGPAVVIEEPDSSLLVEAVAYHNQELQMPPDGALRPREIEAIRKWVAMGVPDPRKDLMETQVADTVDGREHWSFQPLAQVSPPQNGQPPLT
jgi:mono/diheme cytochrome c family protein